MGDRVRVASGVTSQRTVQIRSGGSVTIAVSLDVFELSQEDRAFVFGLIDELIEYEGRTGVGITPGPDEG